LDFMHPLTRMRVERVDEPPYVIDERVFRKFDQRWNAFGRILYDREAPFYRRGMYDKIPDIVISGKEGYSRIDFAKTMGAWTVHDFFHGAFSWEPLKDPNAVMPRPILDKYVVEDPEWMSERVKEVAKLYGASLVGICELNRRWLYSRDINGDEIMIPEEFRYAIVMAVRMNPEAIKKTPSFDACTETALGYSRMAFVVSCLAEFIRSLGYKAIPMGNDTALSIPLAIDAGLGELGRNGLLITPEYGPCVRICKLFTDLPLKPDKPIRFGVSEFCRGCKLCAQMCEAGAIMDRDDLSFEIFSPCNNRGILRWAVNHDKCYSFWVENGGDCSTCIAVCPFTSVFLI